MPSSLVFFGSSPFSVPVLQGLIDANITIAAVVTFPDKPAGRHLQLTPNPVKAIAQKHSLPIFETQSSFIENFKFQTLPAGRQVSNYAGLVAAYGRIIKPEVLSIFNGQIYNIHPSLLPKYRGPSPLQQQILDGISDTGVTIYQLDEQMDHGPIVSQIHDTLLPSDTTQTLGTRLFSLGTQEFNNLLTSNSLSTGNCPLKTQNDSLASYTQKLTKQSGFLEFNVFIDYLKISNLKFQIERLFKAFSPWPGVWTITPNQKRLKLASVDPILVQPEGAPKPISLSSFLQTLS